MEPFYKDNDVAIYNKDCRSMDELPDESVQCVVTSPPFWGLRSYAGEQELTWPRYIFEAGKDPVVCEHEWVEYERPSGGGHVGNKAHVGATKAGVQRIFGYRANTCSLCGSWRGAFGLEPQPEMYILHSVQILREIRRVLRKDGVVWWNVMDSYWGGKGQSGQASPEYQAQRQDVSLNKPHHQIGGPKQTRPSDGSHSVIKPLDLCLIPQRLSVALQEDGWYVRSIIVWQKDNPMPESVNGYRWERHRVNIKRRSKGTRHGAMPPQSHHSGQVPHRDGSFSEPSDSDWEDCRGCPKCRPNEGYVLRRGSWRPTESHEYILMLTKSGDYYCDAEAVRETSVTDPESKAMAFGSVNGKRNTSELAHAADLGHKWEYTPTRNLRSVWTFPTRPYAEAHFAVFPEMLPELCIKAATPEVGCCSECGAPWARRIEVTGRQVTEAMRIAGSDKDGLYHGEEQKDYGPANAQKPSETKVRILESMGEIKETTGWRPTCKCNGDKVPSVVLDPFLGSGTTLWVAKRLGRHGVGYDLSEEYCRLAVERNRQQALL